LAYLGQMLVWMRAGLWFFFVLFLSLCLFACLFDRLLLLLLLLFFLFLFLLLLSVKYALLADDGIIQGQWQYGYKQGARHDAHHGIDVYRKRPSGVSPCFL